jgi:outer membrane protein assembly factor BamB
VRCLLGLPDGTVWSGSTGKGGTHIWDAAAHSELQALTEEDGMHLVCAAAVDMGGLTTVWTGHTNGKVAVWTATRGAAALVRAWRPRQAFEKNVCAISAGPDGRGGTVVWVGFSDGFLYAYDPRGADVAGPTLLRECHAHHSDLQAICTFTTTVRFRLGKSPVRYRTVLCGDSYRGRPVLQAARPHCKLVSASSAGGAGPD